MSDLLVLRKSATRWDSLLKKWKRHVVLCR